VCCRLLESKHNTENSNRHVAYRTSRSSMSCLRL
jgi:hypothetical protein